MPKPISDEELQLKIRARRRILGAIALVAILVVVLPMVLDSQPKQDSQDVAVNIPSPDKAPSFAPMVKPAAPEPVDQSKIATLDVMPPGAAEPTNAVTKPLPAEVINPAGKIIDRQKTAEKKAEPVKSAEVAKAAETKKTVDAAKPSNPKSNKFAVQLGVFSNPQNAHQIEGRLAENQIRHYRETLKSPPGAVRVRAGPYASRSEAEAALAKLKLAGVASGVVVTE